MSYTSLSCSTSLLSLPADCRLAIILAGASHSAADRMTLRSFLLLCKGFCKLVLANWPQIVEHYTTKNEIPDRTWYLFCKQLHRDNDLPAVIYTSGTQEWYQHGKVHRDNDLPAVIYANGMRYWYQYDKLHRDNDLPAVIYAGGTQEWYQHDKLHRDNDLPAVIYANGMQCWYQHGKFIRKQ